MKSCNHEGPSTGRNRRLPATGNLARTMAAALLFATISGVAVTGPSPATEAWADPVTTANVTAELLSEQETIRPGEPFTVGIALRPAANWHTYWINPGGPGLPTRVEWKLPAGLHAGELEWPHPVRLGMPPYVTYGYEGDALLLTRIEAPASLKAGSNVDLVASTRWLACREDACVPGKAELNLRVRVENSPPLRDSRWSELFDAARAQLPRAVDGWKATLAGSGTALHIEVSAPAAQRPSTTGIQVFPLTPGVINESAEAVVRASSSGFAIEVARDEKATTLPDRLGLVIVADGGWDADGKVHALRLDATRIGAAAPPAGDRPVPAPAASPAPAAPSPVEAKPDGTASAPVAVARPATPPVPGDAGVTVWAAILLAFAGGIILNLMPCVFPVLSLKVLGFVHVAHHEAASVRRHGYAFAAGVLASFWVLALLLLALRAAGGAFGWGFQLQEPLFVAALAVLLTAMALNLLGVFEFGSSLSSAAGRFDSRAGYRGSFLSGVLATVLATPCSAPFMGTAVGFALAQPAAVAIVVFTSLGAGMAAPYVVLACSPNLLRYLPRPGAWMEVFRQAMAFPLLATVAWLVWVFGRQTGDDGVLRLLGALVLGSFAAWVEGRFAASRGRAVAAMLTGVCLAAGAFLIVSASSSVSRLDAVPVAAADDGVAWVAWDPAAIDRHRTEGRPVFVDFTADWCLSCKVNERVALAGAEFAELIRTNSAVAMRADWTRSDPRITEALAAFGRSGVPLYVVYPPDPSREPIVLPQILTPSLVRDALKRAVT